MKRIILKKGEEERLLRGHPWVYDNEVDRILAGPGNDSNTAVPESGETVDVESARKKYIGRAFANPASKIVARIYSPSKEGVDKGFFKRRIREALQRRTLFFDTEEDFYGESARLVFAEADMLPGLIVDRYTGWPVEELFPTGVLSAENLREKCGERAPSSWLVVQFLCYGMDLRREAIIEALQEALPDSPAGILEKSNAPVRELEGLPLREGIICGSFPREGIIVFENGLPFLVNILEGQKTGCFLDQKENHRLAALWARRLSRCAEGGTGGETEGTEVLRILDAFTYHGSFAIHALTAAKGRALALDASAQALEAARQNALLNGVAAELETREGDVFDLLKNLERQKQCFDLVILDPPAFAKSRGALEGALRGYKEINLRAIRLLAPGGILISCSCSQAVDAARFRHMISSAAADADRRLWELDFRGQAADHSVLAGYDESQYLKCGVYRAG